ncbi:unnamed protein product [Phytomonas sp. Hart1]|nr:unnamed protein product [Phytomonas sp. Hart1]|eukprot:CCW71616.1 unnamed protein product [Phytomonas sp. isolate Hart1]
MERGDRAFLDAMTGIFQHRNPKHALEGLCDGVCNVATGVGLGVAALITATSAGASEEGALGAAKGFGAGLVGLAGLAGYGTYTGAQQLLRGITNTPEAASHALKGDQLWDSSLGKWSAVNLWEDLMTLPTTDEDIQLRARRKFIEQEHILQRDKQEKDNTTNEDTSPASASSSLDYYGLLEVDRTASTEEIRKAFMRKALVSHPDKNPNDSDATREFQQLLTAYNILKNEGMRLTYDQYGGHQQPFGEGGVANAAEAAESVNPFEILLGTKFLEPLTGMLRLIYYFESNALYTNEMLTELHCRNRLRVARNLLSFVETCGEERFSILLRDAVSTRCGPQIVACVAESYHIAARQGLYDSNWKRELDGWYSSKVLSLSSTARTAAASAKAVTKTIKKTLSEEDLIEMLLCACKYDVCRTVLQACRLILYDSGASSIEKQRRVHQLNKLSNMARAEVERELASRACTN